MSPPSDRRRSSSASSASDVSLSALVREWAPVVVTILGLLGYRLSGPGELLTRLEREAEAERVVDAQVAEAISAIGRERCSALGASRAAAYGYPCNAIQRDGRWPLAQLPMRTGGSAAPSVLAPRAPRVPSPATVAELALTALFVPAFPLPR